MTYAQIVALLAPCGLNCSKCMGYQQGASITPRN